MATPVWAGDLYELKSHRGDFLLDIKSVTVTSQPFTILADSDHLASALQLKLELTNLSPTRKIDEVGKFSFKLTDEFGNQYHQFADVQGEVSSKPLQNRNLYPQGVLATDVLFEQPVDKSQNLSLDVFVAGISEDNPFHFEIPAAVFRGAEARDAKNTIDDNNLTIVFPPEGGLVRAGEEVLVRVQLTRGINLPDTVFVMSPNYTFEDVHKVLQYNVHIPSNQEPGEFPIIVLGKWGKDQAGKVISKTVTLRVLEAGEKTVIK